MRRRVVRDRRAPVKVAALCWRGGLRVEYHTGGVTYVYASQTVVV
jgi:hypothetical protein